MEKAALIRAIHDEPEDETLRLVFADWLQEHGEEVRAEWIRASCALARSRDDQTERRELAGRVHALTVRCMPDWMEELVGVTADNDRGLFRFAVRSRAAVNRMRKAKWLPRAFAEGWLELIVVDWSDSLLAQEVRRWSAELREIPLFVRPAPQISDDGLQVYLNWPVLRGLELPGHATRLPSVRRLGERTDVRTLNLRGAPDDQDAPAVFEQIGRLTGLRRLTIDAIRRPTDEDLLPLASLKQLRELHLSGCVALTDAALHPLSGLTGLRMLRVWGCPGISPRGVAALREALPALDFAGV